MIKNNNGAILRKLTFRSLQTGKLRNFLIILTVALSAALLSGISLGALGLKEEKREQLAKMQHVIYMEVTESQINQLKNDNRTEDIMVYKRGKSMEVENYIIYPQYHDTNTVKIEPMPIAEGNYPQKIDDIAVDKAYMKAIGREAVLGENLTIHWLNGTEENFRISGFMDNGNSQKIYTFIFSEEYARNGSQLKDIPYSAAVRIHDADQMSENEFLNAIRDFGEDCGIERHLINENNAFVTNLAITSSEILTILGIGFVVLFASVLVIYSIFYISVTGRIRLFGQLCTLGTTMKQIKKLVHMEGIMLSLIGIPIGLCAGSLFAYLLVPGGFKIKNALLDWVIVAIVTIITVMISVRKPAKIASLVSPVEASKLSGYKEENRKMTRVHQRRLTTFGLARISSDRNRKKSVMTVLSLGIGGILFLSGATLLTSMSKEEYARQGEFEYGEFAIYLSSNAAETNEYGRTGLQLDNPFSKELSDEIRAIDGVTDIKTWEKLSIEYEYNNFNSSDILKPITKSDVTILEKYRTSGENFDYERMVNNKEIVITQNDIAEEIFGWKFRAGDKVRIRWYNGSQYEEEDFTIAGDVNEKKLLKNKDADDLFNSSGWFWIPAETLKKMMPENFNFVSTMVITIKDYSKYNTKIEEELRAILDERPQLTLYTLKDNIVASQEVYNMLVAVVFGLGAFIIGFSLINLINTLVSNAMARKQEFAMLCSIGMSEKQLSKMIMYEGILLAMKNMLITGSIGTAGGYLLILILREIGATYMHWNFPVFYFLGYVAIIIVVPIILSDVIIKIIRKKSLVERLREIE